MTRHVMQAHGLFSKSAIAPFQSTLAYFVIRATCRVMAHDAHCGDMCTTSAPPCYQLGSAARCWTHYGSTDLE